MLRYGRSPFFRMPHTHAAAKSLRQNQKRREHNARILRDLRKAIHDSRRAMSLGKADEAKKLVFAATKALDRAAAKNIITKNTASRKKSRLQRALGKVGKTA